LSQTAAKVGKATMGSAQSSHFPGRGFHICFPYEPTLNGPTRWSRCLPVCLKFVSIVTESQPEGCRGQTGFVNHVLSC
jgi:hypothetical protein